MWGQLPLIDHEPALRGLPVPSQFIGAENLIQRSDAEFNVIHDAIKRNVGNNDFALQALENVLALRAGSGTSLSGLPIRENLEAQAVQLTPTDTPFLNRCPRTVGSGSAVDWFQITSVGAGFGVATTVTSGATSATQTVGTTAGMVPGTSLQFTASGGAVIYAIVSSVTNATTVVLTGSIATTTGDTVTMGPYGVPSAQGANSQVFFGERGAPDFDHPTYTRKSKSYKLLGKMTDITGLAMAAGANFWDQRAANINSLIWALKKAENYALINARASTVLQPWGDGTTGYAYDGLIASIATANGTPAEQIQTGVGALTQAHIDAQFTRIYNRGGRKLWILCNAQEKNSIDHLAEAAGTLLRQSVGSEATLGINIKSYQTTVGEVAEIMVDNSVPAGTMIFGCWQNGNDGSPVMDVSVLPQVQLADVGLTGSIQGYVMQQIAPTASAPHAYPTIGSLYSTFRVRNATVLGKSSGVTAV